MEGAFRHIDVAGAVAGVDWGGSAEELARTPLPPLGGGGGAAPGQGGHTSRKRPRLDSAAAGVEEGGDRGSVLRGGAFALLWGVLDEALATLEAGEKEEVCEGAALALQALAAAALEAPPPITEYDRTLTTYAPCPYDRAVAALSDFGSAGDASYPLDATLELVAVHHPDALFLCGDVWRALLAVRAARCSPRVSCRPGYAAGDDPRAAAARVVRVFLGAAWLSGPVGSAAGALQFLPEADAADVLHMVWGRLPRPDKVAGHTRHLSRWDGAEVHRGLLGIAHRNLDTLSSMYAHLTIPEDAGGGEEKAAAGGEGG